MSIQRMRKILLIHASLKLWPNDAPVLMRIMFYAICICLNLVAGVQEHSEVHSRHTPERTQVVDTDVKVNGISEHQDDLIAEVERKYWHPIEGSNGHVKATRNGFPFVIGADVAIDSVEYSDMDSGWNMNHLSELPFSLLPFGCYGSSATSVRKLFIGACFASQFWKIEDHHLYSLSYMHLGEPKIWYGIPGRYLFRFLEVARKQFPQLSKHPKFFDELDFRISPSLLIYEGIPVYKCVQNLTDFIVVFPGAFRYDIDGGFNCTEGACFAPFEWLPHGQNVVELYAEYAVKTTISHDKLLLRAATEAIKAEWDSMTKRNDSHMWRSIAGKDGLLTKLFKSRMRVEAVRREHLSDHRLEHEAFDDDDESNGVKRECCVCLYDLYLSAVRCSRTTAELDLMVLALEGNPSAVRAVGGGSRSEEDVILIDDD
ncbi:hypothetical protein M569_14431 [Genlisea aurea]|uniref:JmjC domain-containing protein n=1 Tax=Genlisea aurea TaxID=192259 RepID=S8DLJ9_9LAMI|nr:hypothetical protein M569_14431 [Genlisea aurea]